MALTTVSADKITPYNLGQAGQRQPGDQARPKGTTRRKQLWSGRAKFSTCRWEQREPARWWWPVPTPK